MLAAVTQDNEPFHARINQSGLQTRFSLFSCLGIKLIKNDLHEAEKFLLLHRIFAVQHANCDGTKRPCIYLALSRIRELHSYQDDGNARSQSSHGHLAVRNDQRARRLSSV